MPSQFANAFAALTGKNTSTFNTQFGTTRYGKNIDPKMKLLVNRRKSLQANELQKLREAGIVREALTPPGSRPESPVAPNVRRSRRQSRNARKSRRARKARRATARRNRK
jgi:hypothetical protein